MYASKKRYVNGKWHESDGLDGPDDPGTPCSPPREGDTFVLSPGSKVYKVVSQRDEFFESKFNPAALQNILNIHAAEGWRVVSMTATDVGSFWGSFWSKGGGSARQELLILLEKVVGEEGHEFRPAWP